MSSIESGPDHGAGRPARDPFAGAFVAMQDAWLAGIAAMESASRTVAVDGNAAPPTMGGQTGSIAAELALPVGRAMMIAANRSVSYWLNLAQILASHQATSVRSVVTALDAGAGSEHLAAADELRAVLREVGDLTTREARILQSELGALSESLAQSLQQPDLSAPYRRRWRAKI